MATNGIIKGQLHSECNSKDGCGVPLTVDNVKHIEAERDEPVITPNAFKDKKTYEIIGNPKQVASAVNVMGGGKSFAKGAKIYTDKGAHVKTVDHVSPDNKVEKGDAIPSGSVIINRTNITKNKKKYKFRGNLKQIASEINTLNNNGVVVEMGGESKMVYEEGGRVSASGDRAGIAIVVDNKLSPKTVLIQNPAKSRKNKKNRRGYDFPKGHIDPNETPFEAALRETKEEVGIALPKELQKRAKKNHYSFPINGRGDIFNCFVLVITPFEYENAFSDYVDSNNKIKPEYIQKEEVDSAVFYNLDKAKKITQDRLSTAYKAIDKTLKKNPEKISKEIAGYNEFLNLVLDCQQNIKKIDQIDNKKLKSNVRFACLMMQDQNMRESDLIKFYKLNVQERYPNTGSSITELEMKSPKSESVSKPKSTHPVTYKYGGMLEDTGKVSDMPPQEALSVIAAQIKFSKERGDYLMRNLENLLDQELKRTGKKALSSKDLENAEVYADDGEEISLYDAVLDFYRFFVSDLPSKYMESWINNIASKITRSVRYDASAPVDADMNYTEPVLPYLENPLKAVKLPKPEKIDRKSLQKIMSKFVGNDDLRPVMMHVLRGHQDWDEKNQDELAATDAHRLIQLRDPRYLNLVSKKRGIYDIVHGDKYHKRIVKQFKDDKKAVNKKMQAKTNLDYHFTNLADYEPDGRSNYGYPNYKAVIPELDNSYKAFKVDLASLYKMITVAYEYGLLNHTTRRFEFMLEDQDVEYNFAGFNGVFVMECIQAMMMMGETEALFYLNKNSNKKAGMFKPVDKSDRFMMLLMPIMTPVSIEGGSEVPVGYNLTTGGSFTINGEYRTGKSARLFELSKEKTEKLIKN